MHPRDKAEFATILLSTGELYGKPPSDGAIALYWQALQDLTLEQVRVGVSMHMRDPDAGQYMPKPADILRQFRRKAKEAVIAWSEVEYAMLAQGAYRSVRFADETTNAVIKDLGGWPWICSQNIDAPWTQKEFERRYDAYEQAGIRYADCLPGLIEIDNSIRGYLEHIPAPMLISGREATELPAAERPQLTDGKRQLEAVISDAVMAMGGSE